MSDQFGRLCAESEARQGADESIDAEMATMQRTMVSRTADGVLLAAFAGGSPRPTEMDGGSFTAFKARIGKVTTPLESGSTRLMAFGRTRRLPKLFGHRLPQ